MSQTTRRPWQNFVSTASRFFSGLQQVLFGSRQGPPLPEEAMSAPVAPARPVNWRRLERVILTDEVGRTVVEEYAQHRRSERGQLTSFRRFPGACLTPRPASGAC